MLEESRSQEISLRLGRISRFDFARRSIVPNMNAFVILQEILKSPQRSKATVTNEQQKKFSLTIQI